MKKVFIDGSAGTTGLRIYERLENRKDIELLKLSEENRKDKNARKDAINNADIAFLCLPDDAARESVSLCENEDTVIIDTSTAHRTAKGWVYGFPGAQSRNCRFKADSRSRLPRKRFYILDLSAYRKRYNRKKRPAFLLFDNGLQRRRQKNDCRVRGRKP